MKKDIPVLLLTGYLGSGKTTVVNKILNNRKGIKFAVIVNDIGEVNIDADLIAKGGVVGQKDDSLVALQNGCICCTLKMDLIQQLHEIIVMKKFDYIVIEASGICEPEPIAQTNSTQTNSLNRTRMGLIPLQKKQQMSEECVSREKVPSTVFLSQRLAHHATTLLLGL